MMNEAQLVEALGRATRTVDRLQCQPQYAVPSDDENYRRYRAGERGPVMGPIDAFHDWLLAEGRRGVTWSQLLAIAVPPNLYWRYACEWGFAYHTRHEQIRVSEFAEGASGTALPECYIIDRRDVLLMAYAAGGEFIGAEYAEPGILNDCLAAWDAAWAAAERFETWWGRHPEYRRGARAA